MLPPYELKNKEFSKAMRGYNVAEVDEHINFIIEKYTELYRENDELERKLKTAYAKLDEIKSEEESIRSAMVNAQRASQKIMTEANDRADIIINTARKSCDRILADFRKKIQEERAVLVALNESITDFKEKLFKTYNSHISFIEGIELLDEDEIVKYALSDENYTSAVIQNIKQDIIEMTKDEPPKSAGAISAPGEFVEASPVAAEAVTRSNNVKDTIKELNKKFLDTAEIPVQKTDAETAAETEYNEILRQLGITESVDIADSSNNTQSSKGDDFNKAYNTPDNYGDVVKKKKRK